MGKIIRKNDLIEIMSEKTGFYKKNAKVFVNALPEIILDALQSATFEEDSEIHLMHGLVIGGRRVPEREAKDPRTGEIIISPEKVIPYVEFKPSLRKKLYMPKKKGKKKVNNGSKS